VNVIWVSEWPVNEVEESGGYYAYLVNVKGWKKEVNTVFIFDDAEQTYWDGPLWRNFFRELGITITSGPLPLQAMATLPLESS